MASSRVAHGCTWCMIQGQRPKPRTMTLQQVRQAKAAEKAAKDAFYAQHAAEAKPGSKPSAKYSKLQAAMIAATRARQDAMTSYAAAL